MQRAKNLGELRESGYRPRSVKAELRANLIDRLRRNQPVFPGIVGYERTVIPQVQNALLSGHDFILLGLRGQAKTRLLRALPELLDEAIPAVAGTDLREDPLRPITSATRRRIEEEGDATPIEWIERAERYREKLATPDVTISDLIGDVDPIKAAARKLALDDPEVVHYGIVPRTNRGIFAVNELPDLQARIQVGLLNVLEEGDVQIRGFPVRLPLDVLLVFSANPEDYTNRGNIITPLRDRIASQILTHYPRTVEESRRITLQEAWLRRGDGVPVVVPDYLETIVEEVAFQARESEYVDQGSGVSARMTIALYENVVSNAERRAVLCGEETAVARVSDVFASVSAVTGKIELVYEGEREGARNVANALIGRAVLATFQRHFPTLVRSQDGASTGDAEVAPLLGFFQNERTVDVADDLATSDLLARLREVPRLEELAREHLAPEGDAELAAGMELVLEGLHQASLLSKEELVGGRVYRDVFEEMVRSFNS